MIYEKVLVSYQPLRPRGKDRGICPVDEMCPREEEILKRQRFTYQPNTDTQNLAMSLLHVSRLIRQEAELILYSRNSFHFHLGIDQYQDDVGIYDVLDNLTAIKPWNMKLIPKVTINVGLPQFPCTDKQKTFLHYKARVEEFAAAFGGNKHALERIVVNFNVDFRPSDYYPRGCLRETQTVLEPLGQIFGVKEHVAFRGVAVHFYMDMVVAMKSKSLLLTPMKSPPAEYYYREYEIEQVGPLLVWWVCPLIYGRFATRCCMVCDGWKVECNGAVEERNLADKHIEAHPF